MSAVTETEVRTFLLGHLEEQLAAEGSALPEDISDDYDLLLSGLVDSLGLLELTAALSDYVGGDLDFEALEAEQLTVVGPLCRFVAEEAAKV